MDLPDLPKAELAIVEMTNAFRTGEKLAPVKPNAALAKAAKAFAGYLASRGSFGHTVDGRQPADRTSDAGYKHCVVAENLAMNQDSRGFATQVLATKAVEGWKNSPPHRAAMLHPHVTEIGVGIVRGPDAAPKYLSVQLFGRPDSFKYTFEVRNLSGAPIRYTFKSEPVDVPNSTKIAHTACTPDQLTFDGVAGSFAAEAGAIYHVTKSAAGTLQLELKKK